jgi:hypothetical protein
MLDWNDLRHFLAVARHGSTIVLPRCSASTNQPSTAVSASWSASLVADWLSGNPADTG